jgi:multidrug efflux pump subunit AcrA (membrane-fusion protein)
MKNKLIIAVILLIVLSTLGFASCQGKPSEASHRQVAEVKLGDLAITATADGNLDMPREVHLKFGTPGTVKEIFVVEGQKVKEGTLLAKLDDTTQKLAIASAQYNVELAMNELVEKIHPALMGYPELYPDTSTILRVEQVQEELKQAQELLKESAYQEATAELRLAIHDLEASYEMLNVPEIAMSLWSYNELLGEYVENYPDITKAIKLLEEDLGRLDDIQKMIEQGNYAEALSALDAAQQNLEKTHQIVKSISGRIAVSQRIGGCCQQLTRQEAGTSTGLMSLPYPDTSTSLDWLKQVGEELQKIQACKKDESCDNLELATLLRMAQHDIEMSQTILEDNELIYRGGLNLKAIRGYNLNLQIAEEDLKRYKEELMKTEILAPFDGTVVDIGVKENDQLSSFDYSSKTAVYLVDTKTVKMEGVVDEVDIFKVKVGQDAIVTMDALPNVELKGKVTFVSPFGTQTTGVVEFPVTISLDATEMELKGGLTATTDIIIEEHKNVLMVPNKAIKGSPGDYWVEVVMDEKTMTTKKRQVKLGAQNDNFTEVVSGLNEGEKVIVEASRSRMPTSF